MYTDVVKKEYDRIVICDIKQDFSTMVIREYVII